MGKGSARVSMYENRQIMYCRVTNLPKDPVVKKAIAATNAVGINEPLRKKRFYLNFEKGPGIGELLLCLFPYVSFLSFLKYMRPN